MIIAANNLVPSYIHPGQALIHIHARGPVTSNYPTVLESFGSISQQALAPGGGFPIPVKRIQKTWKGNLSKYLKYCLKKLGRQKPSLMSVLKQHTKKSRGAESILHCNGWSVLTYILE